MTKTWDVFLSHSSLDKGRARTLKEGLQASLKVWFDEDQILPGDSIPLKVEEGIEHSRAILICLSPHFLESEWTPAERAAFTYSDPSNKKRTLIPVLIEDCAIPRALAHLLLVDYRQPSDAAVERIVSALRY